MITKNDWVKTNIQDIGKPLEVTFNFYPFTPHAFDIAAWLNAVAIKEAYIGRPLYIALSGGSDSEFVMRLFHRLNVPIKPVIVNTWMNRYEAEYAFRTCRQLGVEPIVLRCEEPDIFKYYLEVIYGKLKNCEALNCIYALLAADHVKELGGIMITGDTLRHEFNMDELVVEAYELFFDILTPNTVIPFFYYTLEMCYAVMSEIQPGESAADHKARVYKLDWRPKLEPIYSNHAYSIYELLQGSIPSKSTWHGGLAADFIKQLESFKHVSKSPSSISA